MKYNEGPGTAMNDHKWSQMTFSTCWSPTIRSHPIAYHSFPQNAGHTVLSARFVLHPWLQSPLILATRSHSACNYCLHTHTHTYTHKWTYTCFDNRYLRSCSYRKHWWPNIFVDVCKPVLSLNLAKSATLCSFVRSEETDKAATCTRHLLGNKRKRQTNRTTCGSIPTMKRHSFQLNIKQIESNKSQEYPRTATIGHDHKWPQMTYTTC